MRFLIFTVLIFQTIFIFILLNKLDKHIFTYDNMKTTYYFGCTRGLFIGNVEYVTLCERDAIEYSNTLKKIMNNE